MYITLLVVALLHFFLDSQLTNVGLDNLCRCFSLDYLFSKRM